MTNNTFNFSIIQGGMGVGASSVQLARAVSMNGELGVVSGTALTHSLTRKLQTGNEEVKHAIEQFPHQDIAQQTIDKYFIAGGKDPNARFKDPSMISVDSPNSIFALTALNNFAEVYLAKQGHEYPIGINFLEKIQTPHLASIYGAMLAGVDYILMGAGIPFQIPQVLDSYMNGQSASYDIDVTDEKSNKRIKHTMTFNPEEVLGKQQTELHRPGFFPIIASTVLAKKFARLEDKVQGFVVEAPKAGGHNAPPRNKTQYEEKDYVDPESMNDIGYPYFLAGGNGEKGGLRKAQELGATGIQVGSLFFLTKESGLQTEYKKQIIQKIKEDKLKVNTDYRASPTGFPFKVASLEGTMSEDSVYENRQRVCDLGYLREFVKKADGKIIGRCPSEPEDAYVKKGGDIAQTKDRKCICNNLISTAGFEQVRKDGYREAPIITAGDDINKAHELIKRIPEGEVSYSAKDVLRYLKGEL